MWVIHDIVNVLQEGIIDRKNNWILERACSNHMMPNKYEFISTTYRILALGERVIETSMCKRINAIGIGNIKILLYNLSTRRNNEVIVQNILYIPECEVSLLSVNQLAKHGLNILLTANRASIM
jgi:hypothetical protein